ncbi:hypothetical protein HPP92_002993 [Vanilla planifolia]|uniref:Cyclin-dependent protein kinase inhibitor SMR1 n=1 Tax=Vanilla planifolia TaxID=51239 RepID=A0A835SAW3_VANPL|nr:hypothetical protein HPP92_002993 [Vanilla planifolia]
MSASQGPPLLAAELPEPQPSPLHPAKDDHKDQSKPVPDPTSSPLMFSTPLAEEYRLRSAPSICPPPPKKHRCAVRCRRKLLSELEFFEVEAEEIERLFVSTSPPKRGHKRKRDGIRGKTSDCRSLLSSA